MTYALPLPKRVIVLLLVTVGFAVASCSTDATSPRLQPVMEGLWNFADTASWHDGYQCKDTAQLQLKTDSVVMIQTSLINGVPTMEKAAFFSGTTQNWTAYCSDGIGLPAVWDVFGIVFLERGNKVQFNFEDGGHPVQTQSGTLNDASHMSGTLEGHDEGSPWDFYGTWAAVRPK